VSYETKAYLSFSVTLDYKALRKVSVNIQDKNISNSNNKNNTNIRLNRVIILRLKAKAFR